MEDLLDRNTLHSLMQCIAAQFGNSCEVVLHDWTQEYEITIVTIENSHITGRKVGDYWSNLGLEVMQERQRTRPFELHHTDERR
jgi:predicted transcriptional regulator YheO